MANSDRPWVTMFRPDRAFGEEFTKRRSQDLIQLGKQDNFALIDSRVAAEACNANPNV